MTFSGDDAFGVALRVTLRVTLGETPTVTFLGSFLSDFEFFGAAVVLGG